jgi:hypothetical protein
MKPASRLGEGMCDERGWHATDCQPIVIRRSFRGDRFLKRAKTLGNLVGATGFEPATPAPKAGEPFCAERVAAFRSSCGFPRSRDEVQNHSEEQAGRARERSSHDGRPHRRDRADVSIGRVRRININENRAANFPRG